MTRHAWPRLWAVMPVFNEEAGKRRACMLLYLGDSEAPFFRYRARRQP